MSDKKRKWRMTRRGFLIGLGATGLGLALGVKVGTPIVRLRIADMFDGPAGSSFGGVEAPPTTWFEISPDNQVRLHLPKVEMGQGIHTSLAQIAAEELEIEWDKLDVVQVGTAKNRSGGRSQAGLCLTYHRVMQGKRDKSKGCASRFRRYVKVPFLRKQESTQRKARG